MGCHHASASVESIHSYWQDWESAEWAAFFDPSKRDPTGASPFFTACMCGEHDLVRQWWMEREEAALILTICQKLFGACGGNVGKDRIVAAGSQALGGRFAKADYSDASLLTLPASAFKKVIWYEARGKRETCLLYWNSGEKWVRCEANVERHLCGGRHHHRKSCSKWLNWEPTWWPWQSI